MLKNLLRLAVLSSLIITTACQMDPDTEYWVAMDEHEEVIRAKEDLQNQIDSIKAVIAEMDTSKYEIKPPKHDSLLRVYQKEINLKVDVPLVFTEASVNAELMKQFKDLAEVSHGELKLLAKSDELQTVIRDLIEEHGEDALDLLIVMDNTGSMGDDMAQVREGLHEILEGLAAYPNSRLAMATYGDKFSDSETWYSYQCFETNHAMMGDYIDSVKITGGGDYKESVYDGLHRALEEGFFRSRSKRMVILIGDAPGHEGKKTEHDLRDIIRLSRRDRINMNFYPIIIYPGMRSLSGAAGGSKSSDQIPLIETLYPNPSPGKSILSFYKEEEYHIYVYSQEGKMVRSFNSKSKEVRIDLSDQEDGLYIIRTVFKGKKFDQRKLILRKSE